MPWMLGPFWAHRTRWMRNYGCVWDAWMLGPFWSHTTRWMRNYGWMRNGWSGWVACSLFGERQPKDEKLCTFVGMLGCLVPFGLTDPNG